jgi:hypothetical protein
MQMEFCAPAHLAVPMAQEIWLYNSDALVAEMLCKSLFGRTAAMSTITMLEQQHCLYRSRVVRDVHLQVHTLSPSGKVEEIALGQVT